MAAFSFVCRSTPKLLDGRTTGLCQLSETCRHYRVLHNLACLKVVDRWQNHLFLVSSVSRPTGTCGICYLPFTYFLYFVIISFTNSSQMHVNFIARILNFLCCSFLRYSFPDSWRNGLHEGEQFQSKNSIKQLSNSSQ